jgi:hypothetical protein
LEPGTTAQVNDPLELRGLELVRTFQDAGIAYNVAWSPDGRALAATAHEAEPAVWDAATGERLHLLQGHDKSSDKEVIAVTWHPSDWMLATAGDDGTVRLWDIDVGESRVLYALDNKARSAAWSPDGRLLAVGDSSGRLRVLDVQEGGLLQDRGVHEMTITGICWSPDGQLLVTCGVDGKVIVQTAQDLQPRHRLGGHNKPVWDVAVSPDGDRVASASMDSTVRVWDVHSGLDTVVLERHTNTVTSVRFSPDGEFLASASSDRTVRLWRCYDWECVATLPREEAIGIGGIDFHPSQPLLAAKDTEAKRIHCYRVDFELLRGAAAGPDSRRYVNAKVVLLGDTGVGKSGLGLVLSGQPYQPTDSTHGRNVWLFDAQEVEAPGGGSQAREALLWDLAGQPGYRLVHQLHLNEVAVALVVFDSRSETDPFAGVKHWVRALAQARRLEGDAAIPTRTYLVAARADRGGVGVTKERLQAVLDELGFDGSFETSAKEGWQVTDLAQAIRDAIAWDALPMVSSSTLFDLIRQFLLEEKQQGRLLSTVDDLFHSFRRSQPNTADDGELQASFKTCIGRVESRGLIRRLQFGNLVLLQPELLDSYASAMVQAARDEPDGLGFIAEEDALAGRFKLPGTERVRDRAQERLLLIATVEELLRHQIALREVTDRGVDLIFPSQFTRERPDAPDIPGTEVTFTFEGPLHNLYATLAVRLSHSTLFHRQAMWQNAASYRATGGGSCGIHLRELEEGRGELALFYDEQADPAVRLQFEAYVSEHLQLRAIPGTIERRRTLTCPSCGFTLPDELVRRRLNRGFTTIRCPACEDSDLALLDERLSATAEAAVAKMNYSADERRDLDVAATRLKGKVETDDYDVFLCHNAKDKQQVMAIGERLKERGLLPWLDVWEIPPGTRWQKALARQLKSVRSAAVFLGAKGTGPWQDLEVEGLLQQLARRGRPIIPVILEGRKGRPRFPAFLDLWQVVDMRQADPDPFEQLVWGITGHKEPLS